MNLDCFHRINHEGISVCVTRSKLPRKAVVPKVWDIFKPAVSC